MKVFLLDIDGVLNSLKAEREGSVDIVLEGMEIEPRAMSLFKEILETFEEFKIVISSSWRDTLSVKQFNEVFKAYGIENKVVALTSDSMDKAPAIELWVKENDPEDFIILDDEVLFDLKHPLYSKQVKTSTFLGLQPDTISNIKEKLKKPI